MAQQHIELAQAQDEAAEVATRHPMRRRLNGVALRAELLAPRPQGTPYTRVNLAPQACITAQQTEHEAL